jgi:hypothetical protein
MEIILEIIERIKHNIFPEAQKSIESWKEFPWHLQDGKPTTWHPKSSQALAIDLFGTIKVSIQSERNHILNDIAESLGLPPGDDWSVDMEWTDENNYLKEKRQTQVDALARSKGSIILFECKFTEGSGGCSRFKNNICDGNYEGQINPQAGGSAPCILTGEGIRYWDIIPEVFRFDRSARLMPCPFREDWYQLMRNLVLAWELAKNTGLKPAFVVVYADSDSNNFVFSKKWREGLTFAQYGRFEDNLKGVLPFKAKSYQDVLKDILSIKFDDSQASGKWERLNSRIYWKIENQKQRQRAEDEYDGSGKR